MVLLFNPPDERFFYEQIRRNPVAKKGKGKGTKKISLKDFTSVPSQIEYARQVYYHDPDMWARELERLGRVGAIGRGGKSGAFGKARHKVASIMKGAKKQKYTVSEAQKMIDELGRKKDILPTVRQLGKAAKEKTKTGKPTESAEKAIEVLRKIKSSSAADKKAVIAEINKILGAKDKVAKKMKSGLRKRSGIKDAAMLTSGADYPYIFDIIKKAGLTKEEQEMLKKRLGKYSYVANPMMGEVGKYALPLTEGAAAMAVTGALPHMAMNNKWFSWNKQLLDWIVLRKDVATAKNQNWTHVKPYYAASIGSEIVAGSVTLWGMHKVVPDTKWIKKNAIMFGGFLGLISKLALDMWSAWGVKTAKDLMLKEMPKLPKEVQTQLKALPEYGTLGLSDYVTTLREPRKLRRGVADYVTTRREPIKLGDYVTSTSEPRKVPAVRSQVKMADYLRTPAKSMAQKLREQMSY